MAALPGFFGSLSACAGPSADGMVHDAALIEYRHQLDALEAQHGAVSAQLLQPLYSIAHIHRQQGRLGEALEALQRILHIRRINEGLHSLAHAELVEQIIEVNTASGNWDRLEQNYDYLVWLHSRNLTAEDPRLAAVLERSALWHLQQFRSQMDARRFEHLIKAETLYIRLCNLLEGQGVHNEALRRAHYQRAVINFHVADAAESISVNFRKLRAAMLQNGRMVEGLDETRARLRVQEAAFFEGDRNVKRAVKLAQADQGVDPLAYAEALAFEGDWYLAFKRRWDAMRRYKKAHAVLAQSNAPSSAIDELFGAPRPVKPLTTPGLDSIDTKFLPYVEAVFDVGPNGWPTNIRIRAVHPEERTDLAQRGERAIAAVRYRPKFENGEPVLAQDVSLTYAFQSRGGRFFINW